MTDACPVCARAWTKHPGCTLLCRENRRLRELLERAYQFIPVAGMSLSLYSTGEVEPLRREIADVLERAT